MMKRMISMVLLVIMVATSITMASAERWVCPNCQTRVDESIDMCPKCSFDKPAQVVVTPEPAPTVEPEQTEAPTPAPAPPKPVVVLTPPAEVTDADGKLTAEGIVYYYKQGVAYQEAEQYEDAVECYKKIVEQNINYKDSAARLQTCQETAQRIAEELACQQAMEEKERTYQQAMEKLQAGAVTEAYKLFRGIRGYQDVDELLANNDDLLIAAQIQIKQLFQVGNIVTFGHYEQDNDVGNGKEEIEWLVLDQVDGKALLLSIYGLDSKPYNSIKEDVTWETCDLRWWLNDTFIYEAFTASEQSGIVLTTVDNSASQGSSRWSTNGGNDTEDKVFLLSYAEERKYHDLGVTYDNTSNTKSRGRPTAYAKANGAWVNSGKQTADGQNEGCWWLRSPGASDADVLTISYFYSRDVNFTHAIIRPALWVNLESGIF